MIFKISLTLNIAYAIFSKYGKARYSNPTRKTKLNPGRVSRENRCCFMSVNRWKREIELQIGIKGNRQITGKRSEE